MKWFFTSRLNLFDVIWIQFSVVILSGLMQNYGILTAILGAVPFWLLCSGISAICEIYYRNEK